MSKIWKHKFENGDTISFGTELYDSMPNMPSINVTRNMDGKVRTAKFILFDTDEGEDLVPKLYHALGEYLKEVKAGKEALAAETAAAKDKETK